MWQRFSSFSSKVKLISCLSFLLGVPHTQNTGRQRDVFTHKTTTPEHWDMLVSPPKGQFLVQFEIYFLDMDPTLKKTLLVTASIFLRF